MTVKILVADDEPRYRRLIRDFLRNEGYSVLEAQNGREALEFLRNNKDVNLVILDIMMPELNGIEACKAIRQYSQVPIIILTALSSDDMELTGFDCGADEFIEKTVNFRVVIARVKALLKRSSTVTRDIEIRGITIRPEAHVVTVQGQEVTLTPNEFELLYYMAQKPGIALSRNELMTAVWGYDYYVDIRNIDTHVKNLRAKLGTEGDRIKTVRGRGYKLEA